MDFAVGEIAFGRSFNPSTGSEMIFFSHPLTIEFGDVKAKLAPDLDLGGWREEMRTTAGESFLDRLSDKEPRAFLRFVRP